MSDARTAIASKPMWVDLGSTDPGGRFAILTDPQGAAFGLLRLADR